MKVTITKTLLSTFVGMVFVFLIACTPKTITLTKYQCQNGQIVDSIDLCPKQIEKQIEIKTVTKYQCFDGSVKDKLSDCVQIKNESLSTDFTDKEFLDLYCKPDTTTLKKETMFNENLKGKYVTWKGIVKTVSESSGQYEIGVKLCDSTWTWDIDVIMRGDQRDSLLKLKEKDEITFKARLKSIGGFLTDLSADDGQLVS